MGNKQNPVVVTSLGKLEGKWNKSGDLAQFYGVPFAKPPVGERRWKPPEPIGSWQGTRKAHKHSAQASQRGNEMKGFLNDLLDGVGHGWLKRTFLKLLLKIFPTPKDLSAVFF